MMKKNKVILIGWDAADWQIINPLIDSGKMPALSSFVNDGIMGNIATLEPVLSPILWTSIATGKLGDKHGILGFTESTGMSGGVHPVLSTSRKTKALWNILQQNGYKTHQLGWWASHPPEKLNGISVSNFYGKTRVSEGKIQDPPKDCVHPPEYLELFKEFRISIDNITGDQLAPFVPALEKIDQKKDKRLAKIAEILVECTNYHSAATWILENEDWDFLGLYLVAIDSICHQFIKYHPPQLKGVNDKEYEFYKNVVEGIYIYHDMMLAQILKLAGPDATVVLVSDHGFNSGEQRLLANPKEPAGIAYDHRPYGVFCAKGPGIKKDETVFGASLLDVTPTILSACGIPIGKDMDGKPLVQIFEEPNPISFVDSWDSIEGDSGMHKLSSSAKHHTTKEELQQLVDLGYIEDPGEDMQEAVEKTTRETKFNLGRIYMHSNRYEKAASVFEELSAQFPDEPRFKIRLASSYQRIGKNDKCQQIINALKEQAETQKESALKKDKGDKKKPQKQKWSIPTTVISMLEANNLLAQNMPLKAIKEFEKLESEMPSNAKLNIQKARAYIALSNYKSAEKEYLKALEKDSDSASAWVGLANCHYFNKKYEEAVDSALNAVGRTYFYPRAHYLLGQSLFSLGDIDNAIQAFEVCLSQNPGLGKARNQLISIYKNQKKNTEALQKHLDYFSNKDKDSVIIVSGIPRSGTSLMMQILASAGFSILSDENRPADESNPKGYFEYDLVKRLAVDSSWIINGRGKVIKVVSQLLFQLPDDQNYKVIFMKRDLKEIIHSQQSMVSKIKNKETPNVYPSHLELAYEKNLKRVEEWHQHHANVELQYINYSELVKSPIESLEALQAFFNRELPLEKMKNEIDLNLYHSKLD